MMSVSLWLGWARLMTNDGLPGFWFGYEALTVEVVGLVVSEVSETMMRKNSEA